MVFDSGSCFCFSPPGSYNLPPLPAQHGQGSHCLKSGRDEVLLSLSEESAGREGDSVDRQIHTDRHQLGWLRLYETRDQLVPTGAEFAHREHCIWFAFKFLREKAPEAVALVGRSRYGRRWLMEMCSQPSTKIPANKGMTFLVWSWHIILVPETPGAELNPLWLVAKAP